jgi:Skp family chaperone for outer membrane proteins
MQEDITTFAQNLQQQAAALSESARDKKQQDMVKMNRDYENKLKEYDEQLKLSMQQITDRLSRDVEAAVGKYAQTASIDVVVDSISGRVVYVSERAQCTNSIINIMDNKQSVVKQITS